MPLVWARICKHFARFALAAGALACVVRFALAAEPGASDPVPTPSTQPASVQPARIHAVFHINWNGLDLGDFTWDSAVIGNRYKAATTASISALFGAYTWEAATHSSGDYLSGQPHPSSYRFRFKATDKNGRIDMTFAKDKVVSRSSDPPDKGGSVPVTPGDLENVVDPLSAVMSLSSAGSGKIENINPCERRVSIFDGKQRFDLALSFKRKSRLENAAGAKLVYVCKVQYIPIAGMKMNSETKYMASTDGIELWFAPVAFANAFVPVNVIIPTWAGSAQITSSKVQIEMAGHGHVALSTD